jgi:hypothetical protein
MVVRGFERSFAVIESTGGLATLQRRRNRFGRTCAVENASIDVRKLDDLRVENLMAISK